MNQGEKRRYLLNELMRELPRQDRVNVPFESQAQRDLLRSLFNRRPAGHASMDFMRVHNEYLQAAITEKGITNLIDIKPIKGRDIYLWRGDITTLSCGAIVNAANYHMTGCFIPNHNCVDNCVHTYAGIELRRRCTEIMEYRGKDLNPGEAIMTPAYNLPCDFVIHTLGPVIGMRVRDRDKDDLATCYINSMALADKYKIDSIAFSCISTGEHSFPRDMAARIATEAVDRYLSAHPRTDMPALKVIFCVFTDADEDMYKSVLAV